MNKQVKNYIENLDNEKLKSSLKKMDEEELKDLSQLKTVFPEQKHNLIHIEGLAEDEETIYEDMVLDDDGNPDVASIVQQLDLKHHFIHLLDKNGQPTERLLAYKDGVYVENGANIMKKKMQDILQGRVSNHYKKELVGYAEHHRQIRIDQLNKPEWKLNLNNGVLDLKEMQLEEHSHEYHFTTQLPINYKPKEETGEPEQWIQFLEEVLMNSEMQMPKLQEYAGYCLKHWKNDKKKACLLLGDTDSGKGVIINVIKNILGERNCSRMSLKSIVDTEFGNQQLLGKLVNLNHDLNHHQITNTGEAKRLLEGEDIDINQKGKPRFTRQPNCKHLYSANYPPRDKISDDAYYNRWITVRVPETVPKEEQNPKLTEELLEEKQAILNWMIEGLKRLEEQDHFSNCLDEDQTEKVWKQFGDPLAKFFHYSLEAERGEMVKKNTVFDLYEDFCEELGVEMESKKQITKYIKNQSKPIDDANTQRDGWKHSQRCFINVRLKEDAFDRLMDVASGKV